MPASNVPREDGYSDIGCASKEYNKIYAKELAGTVGRTYAKLDSPTFAGTPTAPTAAAGTNTTQLATTAFATGGISDHDSSATAHNGTLAPLASPEFTGTPKAPTAASGTNTTQIATTAFAKGEVSDHNSDVTAHGGMVAYSNIFSTVGESHNAIFRGKDLTSYFESGDMSTAIAAGTFDDIYIGDYINKSITVSGTTYNVKWEVADIDYFLHSGDDECTAHHVVMFPSDVIKTNVSMNSTNTTVGGFVGSTMFTTTIPAFDTGIETAFGSAHVLAHKELLTKAIDANAASAAGGGLTGCSNSWEWKSVKCNIPSEPMIYGGAVWGSSAYDVGNKTRQLAIFRFKSFCESRKWFWLQAVVSSSNFAVANSNGYARDNSASNSTANGGLRPYFLLR